MIETARWWLALAAVNGLMAVAAGGVRRARRLRIRRSRSGSAPARSISSCTPRRGLACFSLLRAEIGPAAWAGWLFGVGGLVFGGSLYLMALTGARVLGAVTPIGGFLMILGWAALIWGAVAGMAVSGGR